MSLLCNKTFRFGGWCNKRLKRGQEVGKVHLGHGLAGQVGISHLGNCDGTTKYWDGSCQNIMLCTAGWVT